MAEKKVSEIKKKRLDELLKLMKEKKTVLIASIKNIPASQFQEITKKLRSKAIVKVPKKSAINLALDKFEEENAKKLKEGVQENIAVLFSDMDAFELSSELVKNKTPAKAKAGQEAPEDIIIDEGPTDLVPGPAISELGALGIEIQIDKGKIHIKKSKVLVKEGKKISAGAADLMSKLDIKPFSIGFTPLCAYNISENKVYSEIKIDIEGTLTNLKTAHGKSLPFAVAIGYPTKETMKYLLAKGYSHAKALEKLKPAEKEEVKEQETPKEEVSEEKENKIEEKNEEKVEKNNASEEKSEEENK